MKKFIYAAIMTAGLFLMHGCDSKIDLPQLTDEEYPRILGRWPEPENGELGVFGATAGIDFSIEVQFTPSGLCEGIWYLDGVEYSRGSVFRYHSGQPVKHNLKLVVSTSKYSTSREATLDVKQ